MYSTESGIDADNLASAIQKHSATTIKSDLDGLQALWDELGDSIDEPINAIENITTLIDLVKKFNERIEALLPAIRMS
ncbi:hypothetical protein [Paraglaciecola sp. MB-3u-78]|uniref:hypothetical protein n=1 Tax=Paraglaciecola sp. MB-3u-78 TaxID=2058332 RepID=UPI000C33B324|nr:hypothetical protein [Paraglaciecola sp. MB-3u-78]PKG92898.1 hypothetical protein CXF95_28375 [Paraglaciecola sp. MB-3u-78]